MFSDSRDGWAVRRTGSCGPYESGEPSWGNFSTCCPSDKKKYVDVDNNSGCNDSGDPPATAINQCANSTLNLWQDSYGYFCCDQDLYGFYVISSYWKGCASMGEIEGNDTLNEAIKLEVSTTSAVSSATLTPTVSLTSTVSSEPTSTQGASQSSASQSSGATNTSKGAIAGGVVGGFCGALLIVGIVWLLIRLRRRLAANKLKHAVATSESSYLQSASQPYYTHRGYEDTPIELNAQFDPKELPGNTGRHELSENNHMV